MQINVSYVASVANAPPGFAAAIQYVVSLYQNLRRITPETYESTSLVFEEREIRKTGKYDMQPGIKHIGIYALFGLSVAFMVCGRLFRASRVGAKFWSDG
jgi:hypothetical protein